MKRKYNSLTTWIYRFWSRVPPVKHPSVNHANKSGNAYTLSEWAGAFGDLGTLIPFVVAYISVMKLNPVGILGAFGVAMIAIGLFYKTPVPVQPMKAIGAAAIAHSGTITPGMVYGAGLVTGFVWLVLGITNLIGVVTKLIAKPVVRGIMLGLGLLLIAEGIKMMLSSLWIAGMMVTVTFFLLSNPRIPVMFVLLIVGGMIALWKEPNIVRELSQSIFSFHFPGFALASLSWRDIVQGAFFLALPQIPLTLGNAIIATAEEHNELFPHRKLSERKLSITTGLMNIFSPIVGGVPMCHGAGGMAGHVRFGARTGGALVILGSLILVIAIFWGNSINVFFKMFPQVILGVILFFAGAELAVTAWDTDIQKKDLYVMITTTGLAMWNMLAAFIVGIGLYNLLRRGWVKL